MNPIRLVTESYLLNFSSKTERKANWLQEMSLSIAQNAGAYSPGEKSSMKAKLLLLAPPKNLAIKAAQSDVAYTLSARRELPRDITHLVISYMTHPERVRYAETSSVARNEVNQFYGHNNHEPLAFLDNLFSSYMKLNDRNGIFKPRILCHDTGEKIPKEIDAKKLQDVAFEHFAELYRKVLDEKSYSHFAVDSQLTFIARLGDSPKEKELEKTLSDELFNFIPTNYRLSAEYVVESGTFTPLMLMAQEGKLYSFQALIDKGASVMPVDTKGNSALHLAAQSGKSSEIVKILAKIGGEALINLKNCEGKTAKDYAEEGKNSSIIKALGI